MTPIPLSLALTLFALPAAIIAAAVLLAWRTGRSRR